MVARNGAIDWLCRPHFDSDACLVALLGGESNGSWRLAPDEMPQRTKRRYRVSPFGLLVEMFTNFYKTD